MPDHTPDELTAQQARTVAACVGRCNDDWETTPILMALMDAFPQHDWLSLTPHPASGGRKTFRDFFDEVHEPDSGWMPSPADPWRELKDSLLAAEHARRGAGSVDIIQAGQATEDSSGTSFVGPRVLGPVSSPSTKKD